MRAIIASIALVIIAFALSSSADLSCERCDGITIVTWNVQNLGPTKLADGRLDRIIDVIDEHDVIILQEVTDASGAVPERICALLEAHACIASPRTGSGNRKEQYVIASRYPILSATLIEDTHLERGVFSATIDLGSRNATIITAHLKPDRVASELRALESHAGAGTIIAGDLNADCVYLESTRSYLPRHRWIIPDDADTSVSGSDCAYDRYAVSPDLLGYVRGYRIQAIDHALSDHHPIVLALG